MYVLKVPSTRVEERPNTDCIYFTISLLGINLLKYIYLWGTIQTLITNSPYKWYAFIRLKNVAHFFRFLLFERYGQLNLPPSL